MYSYEENELYGFNILDPDGDIIATVKSVEEALVFISRCPNGVMSNNNNN